MAGQYNNQYPNTISQTGEIETSSTRFTVTLSHWLGLNLIQMNKDQLATLSRLVTELLTDKLLELQDFSRSVFSGGSMRSDLEISPCCRSSKLIDISAWTGSCSPCAPLNYPGCVYLTAGHLRHKPSPGAVVEIRNSNQVSVLQPRCWSLLALH